MLEADVLKSALLSSPQEEDRHVASRQGRELRSALALKLSNGYTDVYVEFVENPKTSDATLAAPHDG